MKKVLLGLLVIMALVLGFFGGRLYTLNTLEILDENHIQSMGQVHEYE